MNMYSLMIQHVILIALSLVVSLGSAVGFSSVQSLCHTDERHALLSFKASFTILNSYCDINDNCVITDSHGEKTRSWKSGNRDCCQWDGVMCDPLNGHVTELHLSGSILNGSFPSNSSLFSLRRLRHIDLSSNNFLSPIPSGFGRLSDLTYLNLSNSGFFGQVPPEIGWLSSLTTLDLSYNIVNDEALLKMPNIKTAITNLTNLRELHLSDVLINTHLPPMIANLSKLTSLKLEGCGLQGDFLATDVLSLPKLRVLDLRLNFGLNGDFSASAVMWTSPLEVVDLSDCNFTGKLPDSIGDSSNSSLISFTILGCGFDGSIPGWMWNTTGEIYLDDNNFSGTLPKTISTAILGRLSSISLRGNSITGTIPAWLFTLPSLQRLWLNDNLFTGIDQFAITNSSAPLVLSLFWAYNNQLQGQIPEAIFELRNLRMLYIGGNNLIATIPLSKLHGLQNLSDLSLSHNNISFIDDIGAESISSWPSFSTLELSSCNLDQFPIFLRDQENLVFLNLSKNAIHGHVPEWLFGINMISLDILDLSHNFLTGGLEHLQLRGQRYFESLFSASNNKFSGEIPSSLCHLTYFDVVDISQNNLTGNIPGCFASLISSQISVLDLSQNQLEGVIPSTIFEDCTMLRGFQLNGNRLEGPIPKSLSNCKYLQFIDLSNNKLNGTFPHWLGVLPNLEGLILGSNNLHGSLMSSNMTTSFLKLRILDISSNDLAGSVPGDFFMSMKAMIEVDHREQDRAIQYMDSYRFGDEYEHDDLYTYEDSMNAWFKGFNRRLDKILKTLVLIDASRNRLEGSIPEAIGDLVSLRWLNLAHNNFTGHIPPSIGKLNLLESLDLSFNGLDGKIPNELVNLNSLEFFNISNNHLAGPIPTGKQFDTFSNDSYLGNPGLCGAPFSNKCGKQGEVPNIAAAEGNNSGSSSLDVWEIALMGFGFGMFVSSVWGYFILWEKNYLWVCRLMLEVQVFIMLHLMRRR